MSAEAREAQLADFVMTFDIAVNMPATQFSKDGDRNADERLRYLLAACRNPDRHPRALCHIAWTPDTRATQVLEEQKQMVKTDIALVHHNRLAKPDGTIVLEPHGLSDLQDEITRIDELIALNKIVTSDGFAAALTNAKLNKYYRERFSTSDVYKALFSELQFRPEDARTIAIQSLRELSKRYRKAKDGAAREAVFEQAEMIYEAFEESHPREEVDIAKLATGVTRTTENRGNICGTHALRDWLEGKPEEIPEKKK